MPSYNKFRRHFLTLLGAAGVGFGARTAQAHHTDTHFEDRSTHQVVYQCNKADNEYYGHILFSAGEMVRKYGDDVEVIIAAYGAGIHLLGENPGRHVDKVHQERVKSLAQYGVRFHACGNTMKSLGWSKIDLLDVAKIVPIGVDDIMQLQERGFSYIAM